MNGHKAFMKLTCYQTILTRFQQRTGVLVDSKDEIGKRREMRGLLIQTILVRKMYGRTIERVDQWIRTDLNRIRRAIAKGAAVNEQERSRLAHLADLLAEFRKENGDALLDVTYDLHSGKYKVSSMELKEILSVTETEWHLYIRRYGTRVRNLADLIPFADPVLVEQINAAAIREISHLEFVVVG